MTENKIKTRYKFPKNDMNTFTKYLLGFIALGGAVFFSWYFFSIIVYILIAAVISFIGRPLVDRLGRCCIRNYRLSEGLKAGITLFVLWCLFLLVFSTIIPLAVSELESLGNVNVSSILHGLELPIQETDQFLKKYGIWDADEDVNKFLSNELGKILNLNYLKDWFGILAGTMSNLFVALFSVTFISFFFLKDRRLFTKMVLAVVPSRYEEQARNALNAIQKLLVRYFVGLLLEVFGVMLLNALGLTIVGLNFGNAVVIALMTGVLNVIPYIGPLIGICFGLFVGLVLNINMEFYQELLPLLLYMTGVMLLTQLIDNILFQPLIYGNSVHAHPLEIFLVILMAGSLAGIPGMILAIPAYTVLRVILKEFFNKYKLINKLTQGLDKQ